MPVRKTVQQANADVFTAIAHPVRRQILDMLLQDEQTVTELASHFKVTRPAISQHLGILLESHLVSREKRGRENFYRLRPENLNDVHTWLQKYEQYWNEKLDALGAFLDEMAESDDDAS